MTEKEKREIMNLPPCKDIELYRKVECICSALCHRDIGISNVIDYVDYNFISKEKIREKINNLQKPNYDNPKAIRVAKAVGKNQTNNGVVAQARIDGFDVAIKEVIELLTKQEEV